MPDMLGFHSDRIHRHRLNRGGDRQANSTLHRIVICRLRWNPRTRDYMARRTAEGMSKKEITGCLKRYVAREIHRVSTALSSRPAVPEGCTAACLTSITASPGWRTRWSRTRSLHC
ncbi:hypothetical protein HRW19_17540 [Streptomyces lunaelactis]|nr:hypothetical protein [Streptomyces lunaelactis]